MFLTKDTVVPYKFSGGYSGDILYYYKYKDGVTDILESEVGVYTNSQAEDFLKNMNHQRPVKIYLNIRLAFSVVLIAGGSKCSDISPFSFYYASINFHDWY